jgi:HEAT repeat protein
MRIHVAAWLLALSLFGATSATAAAGVDPDPEDAAILREAGLTVDDKALLEFLRARTLADNDRTRILALVKKLGDDEFEVRDKASEELESLGAPAVPLLRQALQDPDVEVAHRAEKCLRRIEKVAGPAVSCAVLRTLARRKPAQAAETFLAYLPFADDDTVFEALRTSLVPLALVDGRPDKAMLQALEDKLPLRRAVAAEALIRTGSAEQRAAMVKMLKDKDAAVRLRVAAALYDYKELESVPVLIALLGELPPTQGREAENLLGELAGELRPNAVLGEDPTSREACRRAWEDWWKTYDGDGLLKLVREMTPSDAERERITGLIKKLKDDSFDERVKATEALSECGPEAIPLLRRAVNVADAEASVRAKKALAAVEKKHPRKSGAAAGDAARLLALRRTAGAVEALLAFVPNAEEDAVDEIRAALILLATRDGKADPALIAALTDKSPERRIAAGVALARGGPKDQQPDVRKLLQDDVPGVRLPIAEALIHAGDKDAVSVAIDLLVKLPADQAWQAESLLNAIAEDKSPPSMTATDDASRGKARDAWAEWWRLNRDKVDLAKLNQPEHLLGFTLVATMARGRNGSVMELGRDGKPRWQIDGVVYPMDARMVGSDRVLIAEFTGGQVTERSTKGEVLWTKKIQYPVACQRLANGDTFIVTRNQLVQVDRTGKEVFTHARPGSDIMTGQKLRNGQIIYITNTGNLVRLDSTGKELKTVTVPPLQVYGSNIDVLPNGRILAPQYANNKVVEFDADGKVVWEAAIQQPTSVQRLPNGHTLVASMYTAQMTELDRQGKVLTQESVAGRVTRVRRR